MTDAHDATRRKLVIAASAAGAGLLLTAGNAGLVLAAQKGHGKGQEKEVGAVEDLMREHGVLRRALAAPANTSRGGESGRARAPTLVFLLYQKGWESLSFLIE